MIQALPGCWRPEGPALELAQAKLGLEDDLDRLRAVFQGTVGLFEARMNWETVLTNPP